MILLIRLFDTRHALSVSVAICLALLTGCSKKPEEPHSNNAPHEWATPSAPPSAAPTAEPREQAKISQNSPAPAAQPVDLNEIRSSQANAASQIANLSFTVVNRAVYDAGATRKSTESISELCGLLVDVAGAPRTLAELTAAASISQYTTDGRDTIPLRVTLPDGSQFTAVCARSTGFLPIRETVTLPGGQIQSDRQITWAITKGNVIVPIKVKVTKLSTGGTQSTEEFFISSK